MGRVIPAADGTADYGRALVDEVIHDDAWSVHPSCARMSRPSSQAGPCTSVQRKYGMVGRVGPATDDERSLEAARGAAAPYCRVSVTVYRDCCRDP